LAVAEGDHEVVWLYPATNSAAWERFVAAVQQSGERLRGLFAGLGVQTSALTFPRHTTDTPEVAVALPGSAGRLVFRWYKLTSDWKTRDWVEALVRRRPAPLAIIGGSSSDPARDLGVQLNRCAAALAVGERPLLLLTTATADRVVTGEDNGEPAPTMVDADMEQTPGTSLTQLYPGRTFRFCFSNRQMAAAVTHFLWNQDDLRPDADPVYMVKWEDDAYSRDLIEGFWKGLRSLVAQTAARQWGWASGAVAGGLPLPGGGPFPWDSAGPWASAFRLAVPPTPEVVDSSVGSFDTPNRFESTAAAYLLAQLRPRQDRALLVLTGQTAPCRRFLRAVERISSDRARRFVVATGDAIAFNTLYRDRVVAWPVQDFPVPLVFFCHRNPIDRQAGFDPEAAARGDPTAATGTEDVLLYEDIIEALVHAQGAAPVDAAETARRLHELRLGADGRITGRKKGVRLFDADGGRHSGTGEHVGCLRPHVVRDADGAERVLPEAVIEIWAWQEGPAGAGHVWRRAGPPLHAGYDESPPSRGGAHGND
jgi:hypothetical protein